MTRCAVNHLFDCAEIAVKAAIVAPIATTTAISLRAAPLRWRSPRGLMVVTRCAQLRCAGDHHGGAQSVP
ncbi:hypothetical protein MHAE_09906 [Mycobacterium haemophilum DSM 44634]|nr:hypothetical protein B586_12385 [Mycobacterium haemophilum DSM 44634]